MFRSKSSMQQHKDKHVQNRSSNRHTIEPPNTQSYLEANAQRHGQIEDYLDRNSLFHHLPFQPSSVPYVLHKSLSSTSTHAESSQSRPSIDNHASPERSSFESTIDHETDLLDEYEMKLLCEAEIQDEQGNILRTQKMRAKDVYKLNEGEKVLVHLNENDQPVKASAGLCTRFMTLLLKQPNLCPIEARNWDEVKTGCGVRLLGELRAKFCIPQGDNVDKVLLKHFNERYRSLKHRKKLSLFSLVAKKLNEANNIGAHDAQEIRYTDEVILQALDLVEPPPNIFDYQWEIYKSHLRSKDSQKLSKSGKRARGEHLHSRATGAKSFARLRDEFKLKHKRDAKPLEMFEMAYQTKEGTYIKNASRDFMDRANEEVLKKVLEHGGSESVDIQKRSIIEREVMTELMGPDMPGRAHLWGAGVTKSQVTNFSIELRRMKGGNYSSQSQVSTLLAQVESQRKQIESQNQEIKTQEKEIRVLHKAVDDFRGELRLFQSIFQDNYRDFTSRARISSEDASRTQGNSSS